MDCGSTAILPYVALLVVVVGWFVANNQANTRETRKEARQMLDEVKRQVTQTGTDVLAYLGDPESGLATTIKSTLDTVEIELSRMPNFSIRGAPLLGRLVDFQDASTGGDFETKGRPVRGPDSPEVTSVVRTRNALLAEIERQFRAYYL